MDNSKITARGVEMKIIPASFKDASYLKKCVVKELKNNGFDLSDIDITDIKTFKENPMKFAPKIINAIMALDSSDDLEKALFQCLKRSQYDGEAITEKVFDPVDARNDYYEVMIECLKVNLMPFFVNLVSLF